MGYVEVVSDTEAFGSERRSSAGVCEPGARLVRGSGFLPAIQPKRLEPSLVLWEETVTVIE